MNKRTREKTISLMKGGGGYARSRDLRAAGIHPSVLPGMERVGTVVRLKRGLYVLHGTRTRDERVEALLTVPGSILCLGSALSFHEFGTWEPPQLHLAVKANRRVRLPEFPPIRLYHFAAETFDMGLLEKPGKGGILRVYDMERTVCDLFRFRRRLGMDLAAATLRDYLRRRSRSVPKLLGYAERLRVSGPVRRALEILI